MLEAIEYRESGQRTDPRPDEMVKVEVCAYSGMLPTDACKGHTKHVWAAESNVAIQRCPYHTLVAVDDNTGESLVPECRVGRDYTMTSFVQWPAEIRRWVSDSRLAGPKIPPLAAGCEAHASGTVPRIVSPPRDQVIVLLDGVDASEQEVPFEADAVLASTELSWFVDGEFVGTAPADSRVWWTPEPGRHEVVAMDGAGQASRREVVVRAGAH